MKEVLKEEVSKVKPLKKPKYSQADIKPLGPVTNLEEHVHPEWWLRLFNAYYLKTDGDVVEDPLITQKEVEQFAAILGAQPHQKILDLCCGQGRHSMELARRGFKNIEGLDRSHYLIQKGKTDSRKKGISVKFREGDARKLPYASDSFDYVVILGNSFGYFEMAHDDVKVLKEVFRVLKPWGKVLIDITDGSYLKDHYLPRSWEWIDKKHFVCRERSLSIDSQRLISREVITHSEKGVLADQFYAERLYTQESMGQLLQTASFSDVSFHGVISTNSKRNHDLGMMERRLIVTGVCRKEWTPVKQKPAQLLRTVVVLMGDPTTADTIKPDSVFDDDDFYTIDQLKAALRGLSNYRFIYIDSHAKMMQDLIKLKGKVDYVFNLCDEGYLNDPRKELHVPALLEILGIPYSGAGPQCMAYCYDKSLVRGIAKEIGIPVPKAIDISPEDTAFELPFSFPCIVKPNFGDSSFGITERSVAHNLEELINAISEIRERCGYVKQLIVEEFLAGKEISVGIIGNLAGEYTVLPITEEDYSDLPEELPKICGYEAKWEPTSPYSKIKSLPIQLPEEVEKFIVECCLKMFRRLECQDYARFDWRFDLDGNPKLLEVNPNPGWCWDGHLAKMAAAGGISYAEMLEAILKATETRLQIREKAAAIAELARS
jgi:D-alanine-D-alanine ligase